ncbi:hypothetical protein [Lysinibacter sp. HNR]|uniref:hypothetical protein n=1 Tax=Lysinibacter sp. HNR TaxID=3031408 RepID=UPI0024359894|nr:hypothetical protein [Lysinibacter sp. HNR]WGD38165.1 hypothetical protein FrondiHNR_04415 [Lysinibacter sp. HNR]
MPAFLCVVVGWTVAVLLLIIVLGALLYDMQFDFFDLTYLYVVIVLAAAWGSYYVPTVVAFFADPRLLTIDRMFFIYGSQTIAFEDVVGVVHDSGKKITRILVSGKRPIRLRWRIWRDRVLWADLIEDRTLEILILSARRKIHAGQRAQFGQKLALDSRNLYLGRRGVPVSNITDIYFMNKHEAAYASRSLVINSVSRRLTINEHKVVNAHVLVHLFERFQAGS